MPLLVVQLVSNRAPLIMNRTSRRAWLLYCGAVKFIYLAVLLIVAAAVYYRGKHPESIHGLLGACWLTVLFGAPVSAIFGTLAQRSAINRGEQVPRFVRISVRCAWCLCLCLITLILSLVGMAWTATH